MCGLIVRIQVIDDHGGAFVMFDREIIPLLNISACDMKNSLR